MNKPLSPSVLAFHQRANDALCRLAALAKPGAKLTLLVRRPEASDGSQDIVITDDDIGAAIAALQIRQQEERAGTDRVIAATEASSSEPKRDP